MKPAGTRPRSAAPTDGVAGSSWLRRWSVVAMLLLFMLINYGDKAVLGLAARPIMHEFGLSPSQYGLLSSAFFFLFSVCALAVGFASSRISTRWILLALALVWAVTQVSVVAASGVGLLLISRIVLGAAEGPAQPMALHAAYSWFPNAKRNIPSALIVGGGALGGAIATPLLTMVIVHFGWRAAFLAMFLVGCVWCLLWLVIGRDGPVDLAPAGAAPVPASRVPYRRILLSGTWLGGFTGAFGAYWTSTLMVAWLPSYLEMALGYSAGEAAAITTIPWVAGLVLTFTHGAITQWLLHLGVPSRIARGILGGCVLILAGLAMVLLPTVTQPALRIVLIAVAFSFHGVTFANGQTVNSEISPPAQRGAVLSVSVALVTIAGLLAPYLTGRLVEAADGPAAGFATAFAIPGVLMIAGGLAALFFVRPERDARRIAALAVVKEKP
ncbi:MFS transporter [Amycolatopsis sp. cg13]|uniref:MFS transporter n=1 Tax=Amycolatopsis sp. cg13 TaxID=3238807 RepID=UPI0035252EA0